MKNIGAQVVSGENENFTSTIIEWRKFNGKFFDYYGSKVRQNFKGRVFCTNMINPFIQRI